jgi:AcrR family transcriptional regulator
MQQEAQMKKQRSDALKTRLRLLEAASEVFGRKGFWSATHEDICSKANANTAAINYHFVSKENLYIEAWKYSFKKSMEKYPLEGGALPGDPPEKRLRRRILSYLQRIADPETHDIDIMLKEMANPTDLLVEVITATTEPIESDFRSILKEVIGKRATKDKIGFCYMSILCMCFGQMLHFRFASEDTRMQMPSFMPFDIRVEKLVDYIIEFIMAGIGSLNESSKRDKK